MENIHLPKTMSIGYDRNLASHRFLVSNKLSKRNPNSTSSYPFMIFRIRMYRSRGVHYAFLPRDPATIPILVIDEVNSRSRTSSSLRIRHRRVSSLRYQRLIADIPTQAITEPGSRTLPHTARADSYAVLSHIDIDTDNLDVNHPGTSRNCGSQQTRSRPRPVRSAAGKTAQSSPRANAQGAGRRGARTATRRIRCPLRRRRSSRRRRHSHLSRRRTRRRCIQACRNRNRSLSRNHMLTRCLRMRMVCLWEVSL